MCVAMDTNRQWLIKISIEKKNGSIEHKFGNPAPYLKPCFIFT